MNVTEAGMGWAASITGDAGGFSVDAELALTSKPAAGRQYTRNDMTGVDVRLLDPAHGTSWEATPLQGDGVLKVDSVTVSAVTFPHGVLAASLAPNSGAAEPGIQLCIYL